MQTAFDRIVWLTFGRACSAISAMQLLTRLLGLETSTVPLNAPEDPAEWRRALKPILSAQRHLIVLDNIWYDHQVYIAQLWTPRCAV